MPVLENLSCVTDLIDIRSECETQTGVVFWLDDEGLSLADASKVADERYVTGKNMVDQKKRIALREVYRELTRNVTPQCDLDSATGIFCDRAEQVAAAVYYKTIALIYKELTHDSSRYNDYIHFAGQEALALLILYDSSYAVLTTAEDVRDGLYQKEMHKLEHVREYIEQVCCVECTGSRWQITLP